MFALFSYHGSVQIRPAFFSPTQPPALLLLLIPCSTHKETGFGSFSYHGSVQIRPAFFSPTRPPALLLLLIPCSTHKETGFGSFLYHGSVQIRLAFFSPTRPPALLPPQAFAAQTQVVWVGLVLTSVPSIAVMSGN